LLTCITEATAKTITRDGWLKTGDLGMLDKEGFVYIHDRSELALTFGGRGYLSLIVVVKDIIIRGGENIVGSLESRIVCFINRHSRTPYQ
jgi:acyl-CoA synthetase (AMP-forming)/AMP-acid ligase II